MPASVLQTDAEGRTPDQPWFDRDEASFQRNLAGLTDPEVRAAAVQFRQTGALTMDFGFPDAVIDEAAAYTAEIGRQGGRVQDGWLVQPAVRAIAAHPRVLKFLSDLYRRESFAFQTLNFPVGTQQKTHSDTYHFHSSPVGFMCGVWVALEDIHPDSGPLAYFPGSQRLPYFSTADVGGTDYGQDYIPFVERTLRERQFRPETAPIRKGQAFVWAANLFHGGSMVNDPSRSRLSQVTHYYFRGCSYFTPMVSGREGVFWREPYDIARRQFVPNASPEARPGLKYRIGERLKIWGRRPHFS